MKIAACALTCVLSFAASAWAEPARPLADPAATAKPAQPADASKHEPKHDNPFEFLEKLDPNQGDHAAKTDGKPDQAQKPRQDAPRHVETASGRACFNAAETREKIAAHRLAEPTKALRVGRQQGEALRARLCRWKADAFVYEVFVLRRDGRIVHVFMNAANGQTVALSDSDLK